MNILKLIPIILIVSLVVTPSYAQLVAESEGTHTTLLRAVHLTEPQILQIFLETLRIEQRHFYTFDAAQGESTNIQLLVPMIQGLENYSPTIAFYKIGEQKEYFRYTPEIFFGEIMATPQTSDNYFVKQAIREIIPETGTYVVEVFDEGDCIVIGIPDGPSAHLVEKKCLVPDAFSVLQGKYGLQFGTEGRQSGLDNLQLTASPSSPNIQGSVLSFIDNQVFFEKPLGQFLSVLTPGGLVETGGSIEDRATDDLRWLILIVLAIVVIVLVTRKFRKR
jgi:hypothetical protein